MRDQTKASQTPLCTSPGRRVTSFAGACKLLSPSLHLSLHDRVPHHWGQARACLPLPSTVTRHPFEQLGCAPCGSHASVEGPCRPLLHSPCLSNLGAHDVTCSQTPNPKPQTPNPSPDPKP